MVRSSIVMDDHSRVLHVSAGRARLARRLAAISPWALFAAVVVFAIVFGLEPWVIFVALFGVVLAAVNRVASKRVEELLDRKPALRLVIADGGDFVDTITSPVLPPWPVDADRITAAEMKRLHEEAEASEKFARRPGAGMLLGYDPFAVKPGAADYDHARAQFAAEVDEHEAALRTWLDGYARAADARARTFELPLWVISARSGAYAEDVVLTIDLPVGVEVVDKWPTVSPPPDPPCYVAPRPRSVAEFPRIPSYGIDPSLVRSFVSSVSAPKVSLWRISGDGRRVSANLGNVHHDAKVELPEPLMLRVPRPGRHSLAWTARTRNGRRHCTGSLGLVVPPGVERPAFTRLEGVTRYPDVPFVDEDAEVVTAARISDPPTEPPTSPKGDDVLDQLAHMGESRTWHALGLGEDGDDMYEVRVERVGSADAQPRNENDAA
jgi:hypothetical protein